MKINLKAQEIEYTIEMNAEEMRAGCENIKDLVDLFLNKRTEILNLINDIKTPSNNKQPNNTSADIPSSLYNEK